MKSNTYEALKETRFQEGCASNSFGEDFGFDGNKIYEKNSYQVFGNNINNLVENEILEIPDYIKIDVDGIEHLILEGADKYLNSDKIKSISVELNEDFIDQKTRVKKILLDNNFYLYQRIKVKIIQIQKFYLLITIFFKKIDYFSIFSISLIIKLLIISAPLIDGWCASE